MNIQTALKKGQSILTGNNISSAQLDSEILMSKATGKDKKFLILNLSQSLTKKNFDYYNFLIQEEQSTSQ